MKAHIVNGDAVNLGIQLVLASGALLIATDAHYADEMVKQLSKARIAATVIGRVQPPAYGRLLIGPTGTRPLPTFVRDEITRLFE